MTLRVGYLNLYKIYKHSINYEKDRSDKEKEGNERRIITNTTNKKDHKAQI